MGGVPDVINSYQIGNPYSKIISRQICLAYRWKPSFLDKSGIKKHQDYILQTLCGPRTQKTGRRKHDTTTFNIFDNSLKNWSFIQKMETQKQKNYKKNLNHYFFHKHSRYICFYCINFNCKKSI